MKSNIHKKWSLDVTSYPSRRGKYKVAVIYSLLTHNMFRWAPKPMTNNKRDQGVISEIQYAFEGRLHEHPYWENEPLTFIEAYTRFYREAFSLLWLHKATDRHNIAVNAETCVTLIQYFNGKLICYSRSTDMRNGYYSDRRVLDYLAHMINTKRPDCKVREIEWYLAIPHEYDEPGIARLIDNEEK